MRNLVSKLQNVINQLCLKLWMISIILENKKLVNLNQIIKQCIKPFQLTKYSNKGNLLLRRRPKPRLFSNLKYSRLIKTLRCCKDWLSDLVILQLSQVSLLLTLLYRRFLIGYKLKIHLIRLKIQSPNK